MKRIMRKVYTSVEGATSLGSPRILGSTAGRRSYAPPHEDLDGVFAWSRILGPPWPSWITLGELRPQERDGFPIPPLDPDRTLRRSCPWCSSRAGGGFRAERIQGILRKGLGRTLLASWRRRRSQLVGVAVAAAVRPTRIPLVADAASSAGPSASRTCCSPSSPTSPRGHRLRAIPAADLSPGAPPRPGLQP